MIFDQQFFLISSILLSGLIYEQIILPLSGNCLRNCASTDINSKYLPLKFPKPYNSEIFQFS